MQLVKFSVILHGVPYYRKCYIFHLIFIHYTNSNAFIGQFIENVVWTIFINSIASIINSIKIRQIFVTFSNESHSLFNFIVTAIRFVDTFFFLWICFVCKRAVVVICNAISVFFRSILCVYLFFFFGCLFIHLAQHFNVDTKCW